MPTKLKAGGPAVCTLPISKLREIHTKGGRQGHKARMELIKRGDLDGQGKNLFELVAQGDPAQGDSA